MNVWLGHEAGPALNVKYLEEDFDLGCKDRNFAQVRWFPSSKVCCELFLAFDWLQVQSSMWYCINHHHMSIGFFWYSESW